MQHPGICLRYFDARARAQFLRGYFAARGVEFRDERVPLEADFSSWAVMRDDRTRTGPMQRLPVLHYGENLIPETMVIARFVHRRLGDEDALDSTQNLRHDVLLSIAYTDITLPIAMLIWSDLLFAGVDLPLFARNSLDRLDRTLAVVETSLAEWGWVAAMGSRPVTIADCLLWEVLDQARTLFGSRLSFADKPQLSALYKECPARGVFEGLLRERACQITGRPGEAAAIAAVQESLED